MNPSASRIKLKHLPIPSSKGFENGKHGTASITDHRHSARKNAVGGMFSNTLTGSEHISAIILDGLPDATWMKDKNGIYLAVNQAWRIYTGMEKEDIAGKSAAEIYGTELADKLHREDLAVMVSGQPLRFEESFTKEQGTIWFDTMITPLFNEQNEAIGTIGIARDITERKQIEEKFLRNQRMESLGSLAGGIAHDLNNILGPIMMSSSLLREDLPKQTLRELTAIIQEATQRATDIVSQLLTFARGAKGERKILKADVLLDQVEKMLKEILPKSITFTPSLPEDIWNISGDMTQLHQVLINLCLNARDAMPKGGNLSLKAENYKVAKSFPAFPSEAKPGRYVKITVADTGGGIPPEVMGKIFDPFFTTKVSGKGTGLGLPTVLGIVKNHGGFVTIESKVHKGSQFNVYFPATAESLSATKPQEQVPLPEGHGELVLIVDDEQSICKMAETILSQKGYKTLAAHGGKEALELYKKNSSNIKAVLTDVVMPVMDGVAFTRALKTISPSLPVIASTGQATELCYKELRNLKVRLFLSKPYNARQLLSIVKQAVSGEPILAAS